MKILIFGTGQFFENRSDILNCEVDVVGFLDNDTSKIGTKYYGHDVFSPDNIHSLKFDCILIMTMSVDEITDQLISCGVNKEKIITYSSFITKVKDSYERIEASKSARNSKKILISYTNLVKGGASYAAINAAKVLSERGYDCCMAAERISDEICQELLGNGIDVIKTTKIYDCDRADMEWIDDYSVIIANSIDMFRFAISAGRTKPTILWLHDPYSRMKQVATTCGNVNLESIKKLHIYSVSEVAKNGFQRAFSSNVRIKNMSYGIPDRPVAHTQTNKVVVALIGWFDYIKGQDVFLDACDCLDDSILSDVQFWLVGRDQKRGEYDAEIMKRINQKKEVKCMNHMQREEMNSLFSQIDIVVSSSREDMLPTVLVEGFMNSKVCITSDVTGIAPYIEDGVNGFVFHNENSKELAEKLEWCITHPEELSQIRGSGRKIYEKCFSLKSFGERLEEAINECIMEDGV